MNTDKTQQDITPEEAAASMGFSNSIIEKYLMSQVPPQEEVPQEAPQEKKLSDEYPKADNEEGGKIDMVLEEIQSIKEEIKAVLEEDGEKS